MSETPCTKDALAADAVLAEYNKAHPATQVISELHRKGFVLHPLNGKIPHPPPESIEFLTRRGGML